MKLPRVDEEDRGLLTTGARDKREEEERLLADRDEGARDGVGGGESSDVFLREEEEREKKELKSNLKKKRTKETLRDAEHSLSRLGTGCVIGHLKKSHLSQSNEALSLSFSPLSAFTCCEEFTSVYFSRSHVPHIAGARLSPNISTCVYTRDLRVHAYR